MIPEKALKKAFCFMVVDCPGGITGKKLRSYRESIISFF